MRSHWIHFGLLFYLWMGVSAALAIEEDLPPSKPTETSVVETAEPPEPIEPEILELEKGKITHRADAILPASIRLGTMFDVAFRGGGAVSQGFAIPTLRLIAAGEIGNQLEYRVSVSQTKEITSALLPQLMPSEAYMDLLPPPSPVRFRVGMFTPRMQPWWSPEISELGWPDYHESHKAIFLSREIGAEVAFRPFDDVVDLVIGYVNGSGVLSENTNNSHALTGRLQLNLDFSETRFFFGAGGFTMGQSAAGAVNYKSSWMGDLFAGVKIREHRLGLETFLGKYEDSTRSVAPAGGAGFVEIEFMPKFSLFGRYETLNASPQTGVKVAQWQVGPIYKLYPQATLFGMYSEVQGSGSTEKITQLRLRVAM